jgi:two-component system phosphate regulon sensor histidine kinase PhoR
MHIMMELKIQPELPNIYADEIKIEQVLVNLIHNAIKFTPPDGKIVVSAYFENNQLLISVTDNGIGIPEEEQARIFERFYKVDKSRSSIGTGLGLAIAKHIVYGHGGSIWVKSIETKGSTFTFSIPIAPV